MSLKALAEAVLARNQPRNSSAYDAEKPRISEDRKVAQESDVQLNSELRYRLTTDTERDPDDVILTLAIRDVGVCDLVIQKAKYDPFLILKAVKESGEDTAKKVMH